MFTSSSDVFRAIMKEIDSLSNLEECQALGRSLPEDIPNRVQLEWNRLLDECISNINMVMMEFDNNMDKDLTIDSDRHTSLQPFVSSNMKVMDYFNHMKSGYFSVFFAAGLIGMSLSAMVMAPIAAIIAFFSGRQARLEKGKADLKVYLSNAFINLQKDYTINPISNNNPNSLLEETKAKLSECAQKALNDIYDNRRLCFEKEIDFLNAEIKKDSEERKTSIADLRQLREEWKPISDDLNDLKSALTNLDSQINNELNRN